MAVEQKILTLINVDNALAGANIEAVEQAMYRFINRYGTRFGWREGIIYNNYDPVHARELALSIKPTVLLVEPHLNYQGNEVHKTLTNLPTGLTDLIIPLRKSDYKGLIWTMCHDIYKFNPGETITAGSDYEVSGWEGSPRKVLVEAFKDFLNPYSDKYKIWQQRINQK